MTETLIAHSAPDFNDPAPISTGKSEPTKVGDRSGGHRNITPDEDFDRIARQVRAIASHSHVFLTAKQCVRERASIEGVSFNGFKVLCAILDHIDGRTGHTFTGLQKLRGSYGMNERDYHRGIRNLFKHGALACCPRKGRYEADDMWRATDKTVPWLIEHYEAVEEAKARQDRRPKHLTAPSGDQEASPDSASGSHLTKPVDLTCQKRQHISSTDPFNSHPTRASAPGEGFSCSQLVTEHSIGDGRPGQWTIRDTETCHWNSWMKRFRRESPEIAAAAEARGAIEVSGSKFGEDGQFNRIAPPPEKRPTLRKSASIATGSEAGAAA